MLVLGKLGYRIDTVSTVREVLQRICTSPTALLLLSTTLAEPGSADLPHEIREAAGDGALPVAMIGPRIDDGADEAWLEAGAIDYLSRPIDIERLLRVIERAVGGRPPRPATGLDAEPAIDLDHLSGFTDGDLQLEGELLALFLSSTEVYLARMGEALRAGEAGESWSASAHALKGASANLGARRVMGLALVAERSPPDATRLEALRAAVEEVRAFGQTHTG